MSSTQQHATLGQLAKRFEQLPDPRDQREPKHLLGDILVIALCSALTGGRTFGDMEDYGTGHQPWLSTFLALLHGIPSHDTFNRIFAALDSNAIFLCQTPILAEPLHRLISRGLNGFP